MDSSSFLSLNEKNQILWSGNLESLKKLFQVLRHEGTWTQLSKLKTSKEGEPQYSYKFQHVSFCCIWYETTKTLLVQGDNDKQAEIREELKLVIDNPVLLTEQSEAEESGNRKPIVPNEQEENSDNAELGDGLHRGHEIAGLIGMKLKKWVEDKANITIVTPFLDEAGLKFIMSHVDQQTSVDIYTREECGWKIKIDRVLATAEHSKKWIIDKITALKCKPSFHAKFLAGVYDDCVKLIVTSCNMTKDHLESAQLETVMQHECTVEEFQSKWTGPLAEKAKDKVQFVDRGEPLAEKAKDEVQFVDMGDLSQALPNPKR